MKKVIQLLIGIIIIALIGAGLYVFKNNNREKKVILFATQPIESRTITQTINATGTLKAKNQFTVGSLIAGRIVELHADDNDVVKKDQLLAKIDNGIEYSGVKKAEGALQEARAEAEYQRKKFARQTELFKAGQLAENQFDLYKKDYEVTLAQVVQKEADLERERLNYSNLFIRSPDDGIVIDRKIELAQMVTSQLQASVLFEIAHDLTDMEAWVDVDEADVGNVKPDQETHFFVDAFSKKKFFAHVSYVQYQAKIVDNVVTYPTVLRVKNPDLALRPGMTVNVTIKTAHKENVKVIPNKALRLNGYKLETSLTPHGYTIIKEADPQDNPSAVYDYVWIVEDKKIIRKPILIGARDTQYTELLTSLPENTILLTELYENKQDKTFLKNMFKQSGGIGN